MRRFVKIAFALLALATVGAVAAVAFIYSGIYNVAATEQHTPPVYWALTQAMRASVRRHAADLIAPDIPEEAMLEQGYVQYRRHCEQCHGGPGVASEAAALGMTPIPGYLVPAAQELTLQEIYWVVKYGLKMTGMPAWKFRLSEEELWLVAAFVERALPRLSAPDYRALAARHGKDADGEQGPRPRPAFVAPPDAQRGLEAIRGYACHGCHIIPGVTGDEVHVGPSLQGIGRRRYIAGVLPNTAENMVVWLLSPPTVDPLTAMPDLGVTERDARDMAAYLETLR